ncbi:glycosyltransferase family 2 protein [Flavobacterium sp.]|uniref:glycosyltransferase family 2 protein n=1 Tax=Flavobacterium sp. TaxID=239 RepID=UPI0026147C1C|nr:glycosyltransferase family 2 protein [Flavobacterium sp.]MDG2433977.1 glycosyltransferase family 2 protein [Flavobacterium sp.]
MTVSLIISTYNWPNALLLSLQSVEKQTIKPNEIIIANDGSNEETNQVIERFIKKSTIPIQHIWQEDIGFRLALIRNKAIAKSKYDYIIQIDGDIILHDNYIKDHIYYAAKNTFLTGPRVLLSAETTQLTLINNNIKFTPFSKKIKNRLNAVHFPIINKFINAKNSPAEKLIFTVRGCNMSFWRKDLIEINGYDENFTTWGREDSEITSRLFKKGLSLKKLRLAGIQYHLYHHEQDKNFLEVNNKILEKNKSTHTFWCSDGIVKKMTDI